MAELAMKYQQYEEYKDSGVEWLGEIPSHWNLSSLKRCVDGCTNGIWGSEPEESSDNTVVLRVADFDRDKLEISEEKLTLRNISPKERENRLLRKGDLLIEKSGGGDKTLVGCVVLFDKDFRAVTSNFVAKMTPKINYESSFLKYAFSLLYDGRVNYASIKQTTGIQNLDSDAYLMEKFVFPEKEEQIQIANFLDHETAQIDTLIEKQQTLIQLLKEKRQAVISHAVTKGLNPDAPMKDSGMEWLGEVPEHWEVIQAKYIADITRGAILRPVDAPEYFDENGEWSYLNISDATKCDKYLYESKLRLSPLGSKKSARVYPNNLIITASATIGKAFINKVKVCVHDGFIPFCNIKVDINYLYHYVSNPYLYAAMGKSNTQKNIYLDEVKNMIVTVPSREEQEKIVEHIEKNQNEYSKLIDKAKQQIQLMQERRTALISAAVTGKIDVRGWVAPDVDSLE
ncbi:restriction endonuclease subunit S [Psychrobacter immobilis]|uniref:restriction endonuclease subunit S n=1 Tax=Psychrobacter immobilis TaxID=498 RepID=UPI001D11ED90|nr:restriction endonuclease subunit S [Psychrobacter immobilis]